MHMFFICATRLDDIEHGLKTVFCAINLKIKHLGGLLDTRYFWFQSKEMAEHV